MQFWDLKIKKNVANSILNVFWKILTFKMAIRNEAISLRPIRKFQLLIQSSTLFLFQDHHVIFSSLSKMLRHYLRSYFVPSWHDYQLYWWWRLFLLFRRNLNTLVHSHRANIVYCKGLKSFSSCIIFVWFYSFTINVMEERFDSGSLPKKIIR